MCMSDCRRGESLDTEKISKNGRERNRLIQDKKEAVLDTYTCSLKPRLEKFGGFHPSKLE
jgi:hypothetical protein